MPFDQLLEEIELHVEKIYRQYQDPRLLYHNIQHTRDVVSAAITICGDYGMEEDQRFPIIAAAWFHDVGYAMQGAEGHEAYSAVKAREFLQGKGLNENLIREIEGCILATKVPQQPHNLPEMILCDADLFHLGKPDFKEKTRTLRKEQELLTAREISGREWRAGTISFLEQHQYFTAFGKKELNPLKETMLADLKERQEKKMAKELEDQQESQGPVSGVSDAAPVQAAVPTVKKKKKTKAEQPSRGVETLFRLTSRNHMELSGMADSKANIMISVNSIIISVMISFLLRRLQDYPYLIMPTITLLLVNIFTIVFAILATRPKILGGKFTQEDIDNRKVNLLFFGHFHRMSLEDYQSAIAQMIADRDYLYASLVKDIYYLGVVLGRKYRFLRLSYTIFMYGLVLSVLLFGISIWYNQYA